MAKVSNGRLELREETFGYRARHIVSDGISEKRNGASSRELVTGTTEQLVKLRMKMSQLVREASSTGPGAVADGEGGSGGGKHTIVGTGGVRSPYGGGIGLGSLQGSVGDASTHVSMNGNFHANQCYPHVGVNNYIRVDENF